MAVTLDDVAEVVGANNLLLQALLGQLTQNTPADVWANATRTLTGSTTIIGPTTPRSDKDIHYRAFQGGTLPLCARVQSYLGVDLVQSAVTSLKYSIFELSESDPSARTAVHGHEDVTLDKTAVVFDALQSDSWAANYNFRLLPDTTTDDAFAEAGKRYLVEVKIAPTSGPIIIVRFVVTCT